jgi:hypothetical protein
MGNRPVLRYDARIHGIHVVITFHEERSGQGFPVLTDKTNGHAGLHYYNGIERKTAETP